MNGKRLSTNTNRSNNSNPLSDYYNSIKSILSVNKIQRYDREFYKFARNISKSSKFEAIMISITIFNAALLGFETAYGHQQQFLFQFLSEIFTGLYTFEFFLKLYSEPFLYFKNLWNIFDFLILIASFVHTTISFSTGQQGNALTKDTYIMVKAIKALRLFRALRAISYIKPLKVIVNALFYTLTNSVVNVIAVILLIMFIFAIIGNSFFQDKAEWTTLGSSMWTLFRYICADQWPEIQANIDSYPGSRVFTITFVFIGSFIFANIFIGLIIMNISDATKDYEREKLRMKTIRIQEKKDLILKRQIEELFKVMKTDDSNGNSIEKFQRLIRKYKALIKHDDIICTNELSSNIVWIETFIKTLTCFDNTMFALQNLHYENALVLSSIIDSRLEKEESNLTERATTIGTANFKPA